MNEEYAELLKILGVWMSDTTLLKRAFTHRSFVHEGIEDKHNERLEFLGDAVLELIVTEYLYHQFPDKREGEMTNYRSSLVCKEALAGMGEKLEIGKYLRMSKGEKNSGGAEKAYILANAIEALIGALFLGLGFGKARAVVEQHLLPELEQIIAEGRHLDAKSQVQEIIQAQFGVTPEYELLEEKGMDHEKLFSFAVLIDGKKIGTGEGGSKKRAQIAAAQNALDNAQKWQKTQ